MSTVGYGDKVPLTFAFRVISVFTMLTGPVLLVTLVSSMGLVMYNEGRKAMKGAAQVDAKDHIIICGWGPKVRDIVTEIRLSSQLSKRHIAIIDDHIDLKPVDDRNTSFVHGNPCEVCVLEQANICKAQAAIVVASGTASTADQKTVLTVLAIESLHPSILSCAELNDPNNEGHLRRAGCDVVINTNVLTSKLLAMSVEQHAISDVITELVTHTQGNEICLVDLPKQYYRKPFQEPFQEFKVKHNAIVIGIERDNASLVNPPTDLVMQAGDMLMIIAEKNSVKY